MDSNASTANPPPAAAASPQELPTDQLTVNLNILSPSTTVTAGGPLTFPNLPLSTTIRQVKEKIRQTLPIRPTDDQQRLIYKGRSLQQDDETLLHLMGEATIREHNRQTIHLVLRGVPDAPVPVPTQPAVRGRSPAADHRSFLSNASGRAQSPHHAFGSTPPPGATRRAAGSQSPFSGLSVPSAPSFTPQQVQQMQSQLQQSMAAWSSGLQREAVNRAMVNHQIHQNQSARAAMGLHGAGDHGAIPNFSLGDPTRGRVSPGLHPYTRTTIRDGTGADGQPYRITNTETWTPLTQGEVQHIIRGADAGQATQAMTSAMHRSESPAPFGPPSAATNVGVTTPFYPAMGSRSVSRRGTPDPASRSVSGGSTGTAINHLQRGTTPSAPEVYILSSPQGPRALLINSNAETYYTPNGRLSTAQAASLTSRLRAQPAMPFHFGMSPLPQGDGAHPPPAGAPPQAPAPAPAQPVAPHAQQPPIPGMPPIVPGHGNNAMMAPAFAQMGQHIWLVVRLAFFVWWLTYSNPSWTRWFTVVAVAITIFLVHTGVLNGIFGFAGGHMRQHMDNLLAHPRRQNPAVDGANAAQQGNQGPQPIPDPAQAAARLVQQRRRANANWLTDVARRLERAGLLFLASIAPGVAERHIAQLEAAEREERRQREEAEAAAAAAAAETAAANGEQATGEGETPARPEQAVPAAPQDVGAQGAAPGPERQPAPLMAV